MRPVILGALCAISLAGCLPQAEQPQPKPTPIQSTPIDPILQRDWYLIEFLDFSKVALQQHKAQMQLMDYPRISMNMGCNQISTMATMDDKGAISFSPMTSTKMLCADMSLEEAFGKFARNVVRYETEGHYLRLFDNAGNVATFIAADWD